MSLIPDYQTTTIPPAKEFADSIIDDFDRELQRRIFMHKAMFRKFWQTPGLLPQDIFDAMGIHAALFLQLGSKDLADIASSLALSGQSLDDYIKQAEYTPPFKIIINNDGTVTIGKPIV